MAEKKDQTKEPQKIPPRRFLAPITEEGRRAAAKKAAELLKSQGRVRP